MPQSQPCTSWSWPQGLDQLTAAFPAATWSMRSTALVRIEPSGVELKEIAGEVRVYRMQGKPRIAADEGTV